VPGKPRAIAVADAKTIGQRLSEIRKSRGLTQAEIAERLGLTQALVSDYERGKLRLHGALIVAFAQALRVSSDEILGLREAASVGLLKERRLLRRLQMIEKLSKREKQLLLGTIDTFLKASQAS
jgi:transcriptional regulator with XRE-family HTH domain